MGNYVLAQNINGTVLVNDSFRTLYVSRVIQINSNSGTINFQNGEVVAGLCNNTNTIRGYCANFQNRCEYWVENRNIPHYIYILTTDVPNSSYGLQVFSASGQRIFDACGNIAIYDTHGRETGYTNLSAPIVCCGGVTTVKTLDSAAYTYTSVYPRRENKWGTYQDREYDYKTGQTNYVTKQVNYTIEYNEYTVENLEDWRTTESKYNLFLINGNISSNRFFYSEDRGTNHLGRYNYHDNVIDSGVNSFGQPNYSVIRPPGVPFAGTSGKNWSPGSVSKASNYNYNSFVIFSIGG